MKILNFLQWTQVLRELMRDPQYGLSEVEIDEETERDYWEPYFIAGLTPHEALAQEYGTEEVELPGKQNFYG